MLLVKFMDQIDKFTNLEVLKSALRRFRDDRNWRQFHKPKDLAMAVSIEAGELLERFLWKSEDEIKADLESPKERQKIDEEMADVFITAINFANALEIDITQAVLRKIEQNDIKYPVEKAKDSAKKYDEL